MQLQNIHIAPGEPPAKFDFLKVSNFLGEFRTEVDKARARFNLGIPDEYNFNWGNIRGTVTDQPDLVSVFTQLKNDYTAKYQDALLRIATANSNIGDINLLIVTIRNILDGTSLPTLQLMVNTLLSDLANYHRELLQLTIDVAHNSTDIAALAGNSGGSSSIINQVNRLNERVQALEDSQSSGGTNVNYESRITALENAIKINSLNTTLTISGGIVDNAYVAIKNTTQPLPVRVLAEYSNLTGYKDVTEICTCSTQNANIASWDDTNNRIVFGDTTGTTTLTFSFLTATAQVEITVSETGEVTPEYEQYVGYGASYTDVIGSTLCKTNTIAGVYQGSPLAEIGLEYYDFYVCAEVGSETISSATELDFSIDMSEIQTGLYTRNNGKTYNWYKIATHVPDFGLESIKYVINV